MIKTTDTATPAAREPSNADTSESLPIRRWSSLFPHRTKSTIPITIDEEDEFESSSWVPITFISIMVIGLLVRLSAADHLTPQIDEPASVLAAHMVVDRGLPIFPSGIPYFQGATLSYALAPFVALGVGDLENLSTLRLLSIICGLVTIYLTFLLGRRLSGESWVAIIAAGFVALDPVSIEWSGRVRMYAPLEMFSVLLAYLFCRVVLDGPNLRRLIGIVVTFWLGIFTQIATALLGPAMFLVALAIYRRKLLRERRDITITLALCLLAPITLFAVNGVLSPNDRAVSTAVPFFSFVGDHLLSLSRFLDPDFASWELLFNGSALVGLMPFVYAGISCLLAGRYFLTNFSDTDPQDRRGIGLVLAFYWIPIILVGLFTNEPQERYLIHVLPFGYLIMALGIRELVHRRPSLEVVSSWQFRTFRILGIATFIIVSLHLASGLHYLTNHTVRDPDYVNAMEYVAARHQPGEPVVIALTPPGYLTLNGAADLYFAPGPFDSKRTERYTREIAEGEFTDYWAGAPSLVSIGQVCQLLETRTDTWLVVDTGRLRGAWAYGGDMARVMLGFTYQQYSGPGGVVVLRVAPPPGRDATAERICLQAEEMPPPWVIQRKLEEQAQRQAN